MIRPGSPVDAPLELWGGPECTVNRVGDVWRDQTILTGHHERDGDLALVAALGVKAIRYPVLWERVSPDAPDRHHWAWSDARLAEIARLGMRPIVGLLHHGSGPHYTSLVAKDFVPMFAAHAAAVARRYPDVADWTPVNEPLTTARFSTLYGHWYPHARDERSFWTAMLNQVEGTREAMRAVRAVHPAARLIQTEDLGKTHATPELQGTADYYNVRRWLTWDLLEGSVTRDHPLWNEAAALGLADRLAALADDPCPADLLGINHYPTSDRFLDHRVARYPEADPDAEFHDMAAIRVMEPAAGGLPAAMREAWARFGRTIAITESHLGCTREEQLRWIHQAWHHAQVLRGEGIDVRAVTGWALFGNVDWTSLLTEVREEYEPGAFDVRGGTPRATAVAELLRAIGTGGNMDPVALAAQAGWWQRDERLEHAPAVHAGAGPDCTGLDVLAVPILMFAAPSSLAQAFREACLLRGLNHVLVDPAAGPVAQALDRHRPWAAIDVDGQIEGFISACASRAVHCTIVSPDRAIEEPGVLAIRNGALFSPYDADNFAVRIEHGLRGGGRIALSDVDIIMPTFVPDLVRVTLDLIVDRATGAWHLTNGEALTPQAFARRLAHALELDANASVASESVHPAAQPDSGSLLPPLDRAIAKHVAERRRSLARETEPRPLRQATG